MADSTVTALTAASALDGTELYYGVQGGANRKVTGAQIKTLTSASPTLVTPVLGVASGTSLVLNLNVTSAPASITGTSILVNPADGVVGRVQVNSYGAIAATTLARYNGTLASPTGVVANDQIGGFNAYGYDGSALQGPIASVRAFATDTVTSAHFGSKVTIATCATNTTTLVDRLTVDQAGHITLEGVTSTGATGTGAFVFGTSPTFTTSILPTGTVTIGTGALTFSTLFLTSGAAINWGNGGTTLTGSSNTIAIASATTLSWASRANLRSTADGIIAMLNNAGNSFGRLVFGGVSTSFGAIKNNGTTLQARLGDDSAFCFFQGKLTTDTNATTGLVAGVLSATTNASIVVYDAVGQAYRIPCII